jgi:hypothetical protein
LPNLNIVRPVSQATARESSFLSAPEGAIRW